MKQKQPDTSKSASDRLPLLQWALYIGVVLVIAAVGFLTYALWPQQQQSPSDLQPIPAAPAGHNGTLASIKDSALEPSAPGSPDSLPDQEKVSAYFCTSKKFRRRVFQFGDRPDDPTFTLGSAINLVYRVKFDGGGPKRDHLLAKGSVVSPPDAIAEFEASPAFAVEHATSFRHFRPGDLDALRLDFSEPLDVRKSTATNAAMSHVADLNDLKQLSFSSIPITAEGLSNLKLDSMRNLTYLCLRHTLVDGNDLSHFKILSQLNTLEFAEGKNTSAVLKSMRSAKDLRWLRVMDDHLTDSDLKLIGEYMCPLNYLDIRLNPAITVTGLEYLLKQKGLQGLDLNGNHSFAPVLASMDQLHLLVLDSGNWSDKEKAKLRQSLPHCQVIFQTAAERTVLRPPQLQ